jgi:hypothetical protein
MKKMLLFSVCLLFAAATLCAGPRGRGGFSPQFNVPREQNETVSVTGTLAVANGRIALQADQKTYYIIGIQQLVGFVPGLTEGAKVTLDGTVFSLPQAKNNYILHVSKLTLEGKEYDTAPSLRNRQPRQQFMGMPFSPMRGQGSYQRMMCR